MTDTKEDISITRSKTWSPRRWNGKTIRAGECTGMLRNVAFWIRHDRHNHEYTAATCKSLNYPPNKRHGGERTPLEQEEMLLEGVDIITVHSVHVFNCQGCGIPLCML